MKILKTYLLGIAFMICFCGQLYAQEIIKAIGTGQTTGHIATLTVANTSSESVVFEMGTAIIPSKEFETTEGIQLSQPQIHTGKIEQIIEPGETVEIPVNGFCLDVGKPAMPIGSTMPNIDEWITELEQEENPNLQSFLNSELPSSFQPVKAEPGSRINKYKLTYPGTDIPFPYKIDIYEHPKDAARFIFPIVNRIISAYDPLMRRVIISTPFSQNEDRQREAVVQQTIWMTTSLLQGEKYEKEDFSDRMEEQFEETLGTKIEEATEQQQKQFNEGIKQFWGTFELVGESAKVIKKDETEEEEYEYRCEYQIGEIPGFQFEMWIADSWEDEEERQRIIEEAEQNIQSEGHWSPDSSFYQEDAGLSHHPTSAAVFFNQVVIGGFASSYAKARLQNENGETEWVGSTEPMTVEVNKSGTVNMTVIPASGWSSFVVGSSYVKLHASSSAFDAVAGNAEHSLDFLKVTKFTAKLALTYLIECGTGQTSQSFANYAKDAIKDEFQSMAEEAVLDEINDLAGDFFDDFCEQESLTEEIIRNLTQSSLESLLENILGIDIPNLGEIIDEGLDATLNLFFVSNTYCTANGGLVVKIGNNSESGFVNTKALYLRQELEENAVSGNGSKIDSFFVSDVQPNSISIETTGIASMMARAKGNGKADAFLESTQIQVLVGVCKGLAGQYESTTEIIIGCYKDDVDKAPEIDETLKNELKNELDSRIASQMTLQSSMDDWKDLADEFIQDLSVRDFAK